MNWPHYVKAAESLLNSGCVPPSEDIIELIKRVNPTSLRLPIPDKKLGYDLKNGLQNLLLENYGKAFYLVPHPYEPAIALIKHRLSPLVDACHTELKCLTKKALHALESFPAERPVSFSEKKSSKQIRREELERCSGLEACCTPKGALRKAQRWLEEYDYARAEEVLTGIRIKEKEELPILVKAARILSEEMGAYDRVIETLLAQPNQIVKDRNLREILALCYYSNGMISEARVIFESIPPAEQGKNALYAYAELCFKDGHLPLAFRLLEVADAKEGFVTSYASLRRDIEAKMLSEAEPVLVEAQAAFDRGEFPAAQSLARDALACYPNFQKAEDLIWIMEEMQAEAERASLWECLERLTGREERIGLLQKLLECDKGKGEKIRELMACEKKLLRKKLVENRIDELRMLAKDEAWAPCFDLLSWLGRQEFQIEQYRHAFGISPLFAVLYENRPLLRLSDQEAKELWLEYVRVKQSIGAGETDACFRRFNAIRRYFGGYPQFKEDYRSLLAIEQARVREEVDLLLARARTEGSTCAEIQEILSSIRRPMAILPAQESGTYDRALRELLVLRAPPKSEAEYVAEYRHAVYSGNPERAQALKERIDDVEALRRIDGEFAEHLEAARIDAERSGKYRIQATLLDLEGYDEEEDPVQYTERTSALTRMGADHRNVMLREDDETIILLDIRSMDAVKYRSTYFKGLAYEDSLPDQAIFLFRQDHGDTFWRATLTLTDSAFIASIDMREKFRLKDSQEILSVYMSSDKTKEYYLNLRDDAPDGRAKFTKVNLLNRKSWDVLGKGIAVFGTSRMTSEPDRFVLTTPEDAAFFDCKLSIQARTDRPAHFYGADPLNKVVYLQTDLGMTITTYDMRELSTFPNVNETEYFKGDKILGINPGTALAMLRCGEETGMLFDFQTCRYSEKFPLHNLLVTQTQSHWYFFEYEKECETLRLKYVTGELEDQLCWYDTPGEDEEYGLTAKSDTATLG